MVDTGILLESGTNEFEVLIFNINGKPFGVNVAKVREIISPSKVTPCPGQPGAMLGFISQRGTAIPLINLHKFFDTKDETEDPSRQCVIVTEFSRAHCAFLVDSVEQIVRASWAQIHPLPEMSELHAAKATGLLMIEEDLIPMVDFEWIYAEHFTNGLGAALDDGTQTNVDRASQRVYIADDSPAIRSNIERTLTSSGYVNVTAFNNGEACWEQLQRDLKANDLPNVVITDIEMPLMDGLALTRSIKEDPNLAQIPVILFSSLVSDDNKNKGEQVGADAQLAKPMIADVVQYADRLILQAATRLAETDTQPEQVPPPNTQNRAQC